MANTLITILTPLLTLLTDYYTHLHYAKLDFTCAIWDIYLRHCSLRLRSFGVTRIRISDPRSVWIMVHQRNWWKWKWIHRFLWCTMIQTDLGSLIRIWITPKERSLSCNEEGNFKIKAVNNVRFSMAIGVWFEVQNIGVLTKNLTRIDSASWAAREDPVCAFGWKSTRLFHPSSWIKFVQQKDSHLICVHR